MGRAFSSSHMQQPQPPSVAQTCSATVGEISAPPPLGYNQQVPSQLVQAPNAKSSSLNMSTRTLVATVIQQIMADRNGAESEEVRIMVITKTELRLKKQNGC
jgi:hypothetical protein